MTDSTAPERLIDPDCRDGKHGSCIGAPCQCACHTHIGVMDPGARDEGPFCDDCGEHFPCEAIRDLSDRRASVDDLLGADPDYLGGQSVDDYIREARRDR
jgi:hypothetical protein